MQNKKEILRSLEEYNALYNFIWINKSYSIDLSEKFIWSQIAPSLKDRKIKEFMCGPFEDVLNNTGDRWEEDKKGAIREELLNWFSSSYIVRLDHLNYRIIISLLFSLYMGKKNLYIGYGDAEESLRVHKELMSRVPERNHDFEEFLKKEVRKIFKDFSYTFKSSTTPNDSSYTLDPGCPSIALDEWMRNENITRSECDDFWEYDCLSTKLKEVISNFQSKPHEHKVAIAKDKGKLRIITTNHPASFLMKNFQRNVHGFLKKKKIFTYIGKQVNNIIVEDDADRKAKGWLLSGDYSNSTDYIPSNLTMIVYEEILTRIVGRDNLKDLVRHSIAEEYLVYPDGERIKMNSGQLMGGLLSFPALCLINYCISKYVGISDDCKKINGDDLLGRCSKEVKEIWARDSPKLGMKPNFSKSHLHPEYGTFNSQLLELQKNGTIKHIPHVQISKLESASLRDWLGENLSFRISKKWGYIRTKVFCQVRKVTALLSGDLLKKKYIKFLREWLPNAHKLREMQLEGISTFLGSVGGYSRFYDEENFEKMIDARWKESAGEDIVLGDQLLIDVLVEGRSWEKKNYFKT